MRRSAIAPAFVDIIPDRLEDGILYICEKYRTVVHKCCCGCGEEVVTPLSPADWSLRKTGDAVSLSPSIGNWKFACKSHYWIRRNKVVWARPLSQQEIKKILARDKVDKEAYIVAINWQKEQPGASGSLIARAWRAFLSWLKFLKST